jgi:hypothetical protein
MPKTSMDRDRAAAISLKVLAFIAEDAKRLQRFLNLTGIEPAALAALAPKTHFQAAVLEYLQSDEVLLLEFCAREALDPTLPAGASRVLNGGKDQPLS